jgi:hypothetical protein
MSDQTIYDPSLNGAEILIKYGDIEIGRAQSINVEMGYYGRNYAPTSSPDLLRAKISRARFDRSKMTQIFGKNWLITDRKLTYEIRRSDGTITRLDDTITTKIGYRYGVDDYVIAEDIECDVGFWWVSPSSEPAQIVSIPDDMQAPLFTKPIQGFDITSKEQPIHETIETPKEEAKPSDPLFTALAVAGTLFGAFLNKAYEMQKANTSVRVSVPEGLIPERADTSQEANLG